MQQSSQFLLQFSVHVRSGRNKRPAPVPLAWSPEARSSPQGVLTEDAPQAVAYRFWLTPAARAVTAPAATWTLVYTSTSIQITGRTNHRQRYYPRVQHRPNRIS